MVNGNGEVKSEIRMSESEKTDSKNHLYEMAQENLIASLMRMPERATDVISMINDNDFSIPSCKLIFQAIRNMVNDGKMDDFNVDTLQVELELEGNLVAAGGQPRLIQLLEKGYASASIATIDTYSRLIKDVATKHNVEEALSKVMDGDLDIDSGKTARQVIESTQQELTTLSGNLETSKMVSSIPDYFDEFMDNLDERIKLFTETGDQLAASHGIPTGFKTLDEKIHGWQPGNTIIVGARTGIGKSVCAVDFAIAAASAGASVLFFSMEMTLQEIMTRFVSCVSGVSINKLVKGDVNKEQLEKVRNTRQQLKKLKITIDTSQDATLEYIRSTASKQAQSEDGLDLVIIDYLGLIKYTGSRTDKQNQTADTSRLLKEMAMTMQIPVIALVQLDNRVRGEEADEEPTYAHIRDSGAIANDANVIILLHRKKNEDKKDSEIPTKFIIEKNRGGEKGKFMCHSFLWRAKFEEINEDGDGSFDDDTDEDDITLDDIDGNVDNNKPVDSPDDADFDDLEAADDFDDLIDDADIQDDESDDNIDDDGYGDSDEDYEALFG